MKVFTIGYGGRDPGDFVARLVSAGVRTVIDVRLRPDRASMGAYAKAKSPGKGIQGLLEDAGIEYRSLPELGNVFLECPDWRERYARLLERAGDLLTERLAVQPGPLCLLCAERRAADCHRQQIAGYLARHGHAIEHLE